MGTIEREPDDPGVPRPVRRTERRWLPVIAVLAVIAFVDGGARLVGAATEEAAGPPREVAGVVQIQPQPSWEVTEQQGEQLTLVRGGVTLGVLAVPGSGGTPGDLANSYVQDSLRQRFADLTIGQPETGALASGVPAIRFGYVGVTGSGVSTEGVVTVAVAGDGAVFDAFAPKGDLAWAAQDLEIMIRTAEVT